MVETGRKRRVLLIEPDREFRSIVGDFLMAQKFEVDYADEGDQGLGKIDSFSPDVVLLSRELPMGDDGHTGPDGLRVLKVLKQDRKALRVPVILASSEASEVDFDRYRKLKFSADDYIRKPFEDTEILRRLENLVGFDISDEIGQIRDNIDDVMDDSINNLFDADPEELGLGVSSATRREISKLLEQVGMELERQDEIAEESNGEMRALEAEAEELEEEADRLDEGIEAGELAAELKQLRYEVHSLSRQLDKAQKQLVSERKRSREIKKEWKNRLTEIQKELEDAEQREARMSDEFEQMRVRFADIELEHTMEVDRIQGEKRRLEEDLAMLRETLGDPNYTRQDLADDLAKVAKALNRIVKKVSEE